MPRNLKYDQSQPKGHHNEENPYRTTKMAGNLKFDPFHWVKIASKLEKSTNCNHNLISSEGDQAISSMVFQKMPGTPKFDQFHSVKIVQKLEKSTDREHELISSEGGQDTSACKI